MQGTIKSLKPGFYGFIDADGYPQGLFFHGKNVSGVAFEELQPGQAVTFDVVPNRRKDGSEGFAAVDVTVDTNS
jgi:cold shock CspA family protein